MSWSGSVKAKLEQERQEGAGAGDYAAHVNPQWVRLLDALGMNVRYLRCRGAELECADGRRVLDFLSGYGVHNAGHNHPRIVAALRTELAAEGPAMLQSHVPELAAALAARLCQRAAGRVNKVFFCSSGSEGIEAALKFARACTGRTGILYAHKAFHGLTYGALSLMSDPFWNAGFGPLLPGALALPFGDLPQLAHQLATKAFAALVLEPIQGEGGVVLPPQDYLIRAQELCRRYGTLLILDEVQTGLYRTGPFLAAHHFGVEPDMVVLAKALSGGLVPSAAVLMSELVYKRVYSSLQRALIHTSTYSENALAMRAGLATLEVLEDEQAGARALQLGEQLRAQLRQRLAGFEMVGEVRGLGLMNAVEFRPPRRLRLRVPFEAFRRIHPAMFGQVLVMRMFREHDILCQICGNNFMALKVLPPLTIEPRQMERFVAALGNVVELMHSRASYWSEALAMAGRVTNIL
ncbi:MAG TPA: aspartate aminotransferase family protein [Candidatus Binataceae bacterium]|nr:aspartate aminotransferase family protein [Candidatus Binataceae bacterium]